MTLAQWLDWAPVLEQLYQQELGRSCFSDPEAFVAWTWHWREHGRNAEEIRAYIRDSPEWKARQDSPPAPAPEPHVDPAPLAGAGRVIRVTDERDGELLNRGYSYWPQSVALGAHIVCFAGHADGRPRFFQVDLIGGEINRLGSVVPYYGTGEGWYFDLEGWVYLLEGPRLRRVHPFTREDRIIFDIEGSHPGCILWQAHSSEDGQTHSATVKRITSDGPYQPLGTVVFRHGRQHYFPANGALDESQIDTSGQWLIIKEDNDNRIIDLDSRDTRWLRQNDGAVGHSDCGLGYVVGEDDVHGACVLWQLDRPLTEGNRRELFHTWGMGEVSVRGGRCLLSDHSALSLVALDGSGVTHLHDHRMVGSGYDFQCHANLDPSGRVACWISNQYGRFDLFLMVIP